jgi:transposase
MVTEHSADTRDARRIEVFTGAGRRRAWSAEEKARIVAETVTSGESVCAVARRHGLSPQQLFGWRRQAREPLATRAEPLLVPAVVETLPTEPRPQRRQRRAVELEIDGVSVRVGRGADARTVAAVIRALKAGT